MMPVCSITLSEIVDRIEDENIIKIREIVADELNSKSRFLDKSHIVIRLQKSIRLHMLGDVEVEVFAQLYIRRFFDRDRRAKNISKRISDLLNVGCATWINMGMIGYARVTPDGSIFYSDKTILND